MAVNGVRAEVYHMQQQRRYERGEVIFREGEDSDSVYRIIDGRVEVVKEDGPQRVVLGQIGKGEYVGEMGAIEGRPRSATVWAESDVTVEWIERAEFLRRVSENSETALELIIRLSQRLGSLNRTYAESVLSARPMSQTDQISTSPAPKSSPSKVSIFGDSQALEDFLPPEGLVIDTYPYVVGRLSQKGESAPAIDVNLTLEDSKPYRMSRAHFAILRTQNGVQVQDLESALGTSVNGMFLGRHFGSDRTSLKRGENFIAAGGIDSKFKFRVVC
jgi:hypothetical protein